MSNFNIVSDIKITIRSLKELNNSRRALKEARNNLEQDALERRVQHRQRMFDIEREHERRMKMYDEQAAAQTALQAAKMKVFDDAEVARECLSKQIDEVLLKLRDKNIPDKESVLLELHDLNNKMHELAMAALNA